MVQDGIIVEVKHLQVIHSRKGILLPMIPHSIDGKCVQKEVQMCFTESIKQTIERNNWSNPKKSGEALKDLNILVEAGYPPMNFEKSKKGSKPNFNAQNKQIYSIQYYVEAKSLILMARPFFRSSYARHLVRKPTCSWSPTRTPPQPQ